MSLCQVADQILQQRRKAVATVLDTIVVSVPLPATGCLVDVLLSHGQTYVRDIQKFLVPRVISHSGYRWHNAPNRNEMMQFLRTLTLTHTLSPLSYLVIFQPYFRFQSPVNFYVTLTIYVNLLV